MRGRIYCATATVVLLALLAGSGSPAWGAPQEQSRDPLIHIVQWGESATLIARLYGVSLAAIVEANGLTNPDFIYAGQRLAIPLGTSPSMAPASGQTTTYVVSPGDTLNVLAARFGTTVNAIVSLNRLSNPDFIWVGQRLQVPGSGAPAPSSSTCTYVVRPRDNLTTIALNYRTTVWAIAIANNLTNPSFIWVGQRLVIPGCSERATSTPTPKPQPPTPTRTPSPRSNGGDGSPKNLIVVIWDGTQLAHLREMLDGGELPHLRTFISENQALILPTINSATCQPGSGDGYRTQTGPANPAIATGLGYPGMANWTNDDPHPVPDGLTLWEWFKGRGYTTGIVSSKDEPFWPLPPLSNARAEIDYWVVADQPQSWVTDKALEFIRNSASSAFFLWVHYREPDEVGHEFGENSVQYSQSLAANDQQFRRFVNELRSQGIESQTLLVLTTDHGFNEGGLAHSNCARDTKDLFLAASKNGSSLSGCIVYQTDIAPCVKEVL